MVSHLLDRILALSGEFVVRVLCDFAQVEESPRAGVNRFQNLLHGLFADVSTDVISNLFGKWVRSADGACSLTEVTLNFYWFLSPNASLINSSALSVGTAISKTWLCVAFMMWGEDSAASESLFALS
jgi:hypothetical protein